MTKRIKKEQYIFNEEEDNIILKWFPIRSANYIKNEYFIEKQCDFKQIARRGNKLGIHKLNNELIISEKQNQIILGSLFGDGNLKRNNKMGKFTHYFREQHAEGEKQYIEWKYGELLSLTNQKGLNYVIKENREIKKGHISICQNAYEFQTKTSISFNRYLDKEKYLLVNEFSELAYIIWFLDDGWCSVSGNTISYLISAYQFNNQELEYINNTINNNLELDGRICSRKELYYPVKNTSKITEIILKYIPKNLDIIYKKLIKNYNKIGIAI